MKNLLLLFLVSILTLAGAGTILANQRGEQLYTKALCFSCHGPKGEGIRCDKTKKNSKTGEIKCLKGDYKPQFAHYPMLAGQNAAYLEAQMKDILINKTRANGQARAMYDTVVKGNLLEQNGIKESDFKDIADFLSQQKQP